MVYGWAMPLKGKPWSGRIHQKKVSLHRGSQGMSARGGGQVERRRPNNQVPGKEKTKGLGMKARDANTKNRGNRMDWGVSGEEMMKGPKCKT